MYLRTCGSFKSSNRKKDLARKSARIQFAEDLQN